MEKALIIDNKYQKIEEIGKGGFGRVFLVIKDNKKYAMKISKKSDIEMLDNEIKIFNEILKFDKDNKYIIKMIDHGEDLYNSKIKKYLVLEYAPKGTLFNYIYDENNYFNGGLGEKYGKFIFSKILIGVQAIHNAGICHLDLTLKNILLDEYFNPKIADFGLAHLIESKNNEKIYFNKGTIGFASPERLFNMPFNGIKADIFSLGVILLYLVTGKPTFQIPEARLNDEAYKNIIKKAYNLFWNNIDQTDSLSKEFKDLYEKMVHYTASKRPSINDILDHPWMKKDLYNNEKEEDLEKQIYKEFTKRETIINENKSKGNTININKKEIQIKDIKSTNQSIPYFTDNFQLKYIDDNKMNIKDYLIIKGDLNPLELMNLIGNEIKQEIDNCYIEPSNKYFKFDIKIEYEEEEENESLPEDLKEELKELGIETIDDYNNCIKRKNLNIQVKLFKTINGHYLLRFFKKHGEIED